MTKTDLENLILAGNVSDAATAILDVRSLPWVFDNSAGRFKQFRQTVGTAVGIQSSQILIVGSARFGFSLHPEKRWRQFSPQSDLDVVIVSEELFDQTWLDLLAGAYPRRGNAKLLRGWMGRVRNDLYTGWVFLGNVKPERFLVDSHLRRVLDLRACLFNALKNAGHHVPRRHRGSTARIYRTWDHVVAYHRDSLRALASRLPKGYTTS